MEKVMIKKLSDGAVLPKKATSGSIAYDVFVPKDTVVRPGRQVIPLGFAVELPGRLFEAKIEPRSGFSAKGMEGYEYKEIERLLPDSGGGCHSKLIRMLSMDADRFDADVVVGKVDSDYRGEVGVIVNSRDQRSFMVKKRSRIAQMTIYDAPAVDFEVTDELTPTDRPGGFGSTGTN